MLPIKTIVSLGLTALLMTVGTLAGAAKGKPSKKRAVSKSKRSVMRSLQKALSSKDLGKRIEGVEALLKIKPTPAYTAARLVSALKADGDGNLRSFVAESILKIAPGSEIAIKALGRSSHKDKDINVRVAAFTALKQCGKTCKAAVPALKKSLDHYDVFVKKHAAAALSAILEAKVSYEKPPAKKPDEKKEVKKEPKKDSK